MRTKEGKRQALMESTMRLVAEERLENFSCRKAAMMAGCTERLLFIYFETKEELLYQCYQQINDEIAALLGQLEQPDDSAEEWLRRLWDTYCRFLIDNSYRSLYFFEYCSSEHMERVPPAKSVHAKALSGVYQALDQQYQLSEKISYETFCLYFLDSATSFSIRVIRGDLPNREGTHEEIWLLFSKGLLAGKEG
jgi:AcrR family transcriptional regulator